MQQKYTRDAKRRIQFHPHWLQDRCRRCGAWLPEMAEQERQLDATRWWLIWTCLRCAFENHEISGKPLTTFLPDPSADIVQPGSLPPCRSWRLPLKLAWDLEGVAERFAETVDRSGLAGLPSVLDHEGIHRAAWGEFTGDAHDPTGARLALARLRHAPASIVGARLAATIAERAVLATGAVFEELARIAPLADAIARNHAGRDSERDRVFSVPFLFPADLESGDCVAPVIGAGRLSIANRYEDWLLTHGAYPWLGHRHPGLRRGPIPAGTEFAASCVEIADVILGAIDLFGNADSDSELLSDVLGLQRLMADWRRLQGGCWDVDWRWERHWPKLPNHYWLKRWERP